MKILVIGASATGCFAALLLARNGHDVVIVDKDQYNKRRVRQIDGRDGDGRTRRRSRDVEGDGDDRPAR